MRNCAKLFYAINVNVQSLTLAYLSFKKQETAILFQRLLQKNEALPRFTS